MKAAGLITVAGQSKRMQAFKPLLPINGVPMITQTASVFLRAGVTSLFVVVGKRGEEVIAALKDIPAQFLWNSRFEETEMFASLQIGLTAIRNTGGFEAAFLLPGDMPAIEPEVLQALMQEMQAGDWDVVFPSDGSRRLHPPLIHERLFDPLIAYSGEDGMRGAFRAIDPKIGYVLTTSSGCMLDVDTQEDYARVQHYMKKPNTQEDEA